MRQIITENSPSTSNSKNRRKSEVKEISFSLLRVPFFLEPHYDESKPFIESNRDRLIKKWGGKFKNGGMTSREEGWR